MNDVLSSFMIKPVPEGYMISYTHSFVEDDGTLVRRNSKASFLAVDEGLISHIEAIADFIKQSKLQ